MGYLVCAFMKYIMRISDAVRQQNEFSENRLVVTIDHYRVSVEKL